MVCLVSTCFTIVARPYGLVHVKIMVNFIFNNPFKAESYHSILSLGLCDNYVGNGMLNGITALGNCKVGKLHDSTFKCNTKAPKGLPLKLRVEQRL